MIWARRSNFFIFKIYRHLTVTCSITRRVPNFSYETSVNAEKTWKRFICLNKILEFKIDQGKLNLKECWNCHKLIKPKEFFCLHCSAMQYPDSSINFFELFDVNPEYQIDVEYISKKFKDLQKTFHPDKAANKLKEEMIISEYYSKTLNEAYATLKDPLKRGVYLLKLNGLTIDAAGINLDPDFLSEIMDKNEEVDQIEDNSSLQKQIVLLKGKQEETLKELSKAFKENNLSEAQLLAVKLKYYDNLEKKLREKKLTLGIID